jgi:two-component system response regulator AtoC
MNERLVLLIGDDPRIQQHVGSLLRGWAYEPRLASSVDDALVALDRQPFLFSVVDDGDNFRTERLVRRLERHGGQAGPIVVLTENVQLVETPSAFGADAVVVKPFTPEDLETAIKEALSGPRRPGKAIHPEEARIRHEMSLCSSPKMREVWNIVEQAAGVDVTVLLCGETGTGKDLLARAIHWMSPRRDRPFIKVNCAAVPRELLESELFGHERGAFTGAHQLKIGKFESANHGTVFLDEIGDLHPALQAKLLHVLQDGTFSRVGGRSTIEVDVRVLSATNQDLARAVQTERFRQDLYYRLNVVQIVVPPLRERAEEILLLADYFVRRYAEAFKRPGFAITPAGLERLSRHRYPGNVRELENLIKRMIVLNDPSLIRSRFAVTDPNHAVEPAPDPPVATPLSLKTIARSAARAAEGEAIARALKETSWNRVKAAKLLKISYRALLYKMKDVGLAQDRTTVRSGA